MSTSLDKRRESLQKIVPALGLQERMTQLAERNEADIRRAALADPDAQPSTDEQLRQGQVARRVRLDKSRAPS